MNRVDPRENLAASKRIIIKVGSAVLAPGGELSVAAVERLCRQIAELSQAGKQVVLVSSGAVASGFRQLGLEKPPKTIRLKQAAAAIGQQRLMARYAAAMEKSHIHVAQVLLTAEDFDQRSRFLNARHTLETLLEHGVVPIINENDSVSFDEIKLGDNDRLSALTASMLRADMLIMLSSVPGLLGVSRRVLSSVQNIGEARAHVRTEKSGVGTGGMSTKLDAASIVTRVGIPAIIASGEVDRVVPRILAGEDLGTIFEVEKKGKHDVDARRQWIGLSARPKGAIIIDSGASAAVRSRGASLLPSGITSTEGEFERGSIVEIREKGGEAIAKGLSAYSAEEINLIKGKKAGDIAKILGYIHAGEVVHRDDLLLNKAGETA